MKLVKIYANKNFKNIEFNAKFNVVLAIINDKLNKKDTHNLGKTSLIHVINFILLGSFNKKIFENAIFNGVIFYGELKLNSGQYLTIRRGIDTNTKISFKLSDDKSKSFDAPSIWDEENIPFEKSRKKLNEYLGFDVVTNYDYRKSITYFLRTQQDFLDVYKLDKFKGKHIDWKPFVFELLGYDSNLIVNKLSLEDDIEKKKGIIKVLKEEARINIEDRDKLAGLLDIKKQDLEIALQTIDKFNFFEQDKTLNKELIDQIDSNIQLLSTERYRLDYEINKIEESLSHLNLDIKIEDLEVLYKETELYFPEVLKKDFSELIKFNEAISKDRRKYLNENLEELKTQNYTVNKELKALELDKSEKLAFLTEKDSYEKFKSYQKQLSKLEAEITRINDKIQAVDQSVEIEEQIQGIHLQVENAVTAIREAVNKRKHADINKIFNNIIYDILGTNALISIQQNKQGNVEYSADYQNPSDLLNTSESQGTTYKKLLCMAFDLALLIHYRKKSFFRFAYHDGILEGLDDRIKIRLLNKIKSLCEEYDLQYILSLIDSDIPTDEKGEKYKFTSDEICLELNDKDDLGKIFLNSF
ncbi:DUF2326 domain-containing protein [Chryseobacterium sp. RU33C]|uniref:DUF2326 domain-containing protein n=1 Tax=Chryseobacterium sp. RU33C TaxID=1907398 RepID=UPI000956DD18|nr:DUF2326 domain-containing protein [Chryseobacterium sp. RU33C]SIR07650.1 Uncharacterized protein YydD, contains DUF2326 domain [Chryseobacterium sp. RU33C]